MVILQEVMFIMQMLVLFSYIYEKTEISQAELFLRWTQDTAWRGVAP